MRLPYRWQKFRYGAFKYIILTLLILIPLAPINKIAGQEQQIGNTPGQLKNTSLTQQSTTSTAPLWGGSISQLNSSPIRVQKTVKLHHFDLPCESCHGTDGLTPEGKIQGGNIEPKGIDINKTCTSLSCHDYDKVLNHPINVNVTGTTPEDMPLDGLRITCLTCHNQPKSSSLPSDDAGGEERHLQVPNGIDLCRSCHMNMPGSPLKQSHWQFSSLAHLGKIKQQSGLNVNSTRSTGGIDTESRACLSCHQDITVSIPGYSEVPSQKWSQWGKMTNHSIGMEYSRIALQKASRYKYPLMNSDRIRLFDGKVGCGSCHSLYSEQKGLLVQSNFRSALCFECHDL